ncbi:T9SS type B sorting domain-containing protein [Dawidia soli]|uniref:Gliding motility-associated C-terminal domain-containing protein n=1 Tax=Dawidia soli TaxID=2782352 RepID=A0AAP2GH54_9BACT|nr:gliding motility-associated C-terminal domain-containing protein [Dawidia soli]MBT1685688.1 gliding motility-associated C-terminal domain-containing protein [Dawidia soli]
MTRYFYRLIFLLATVIPAGTYAQNFSGHNWYFGNRGIRFSRGDNSVSLITNRYTGPFGTGAGGTAVVSDPYTGTLLFYTDGVNVIDASHRVAPGGPLGGINTRNQSVTVCKNPSFPGEYYIFYAVAGGGVQYAVFDSTRIGNGTAFGQPPLGELTDVNNAITGLPTGLSEGMIMLPDPNSDGYWLVTHASASATYHFVKIDNTGVNYIGNVTAGTITNAVNFSYHPATRTLGVSPGEAGRSVELATITFPPAPVPPAPQTLPTLAVTSVPGSTSPVANGIYDTEFSSSGRYLYVSRTSGGAGDVVQYDLKPTATPTPAPASVLTGTAPTAGFGLQMGPDSVLYYLYASGANVALGGFTNTDTVASEVDYDASIFAGNFGARQFPSFAPFDSVNWVLDFTSDGTCANSNISFFPEVKPQADSLVWTFGDGGTSSEWSPVYNYPDEGTYTVTMKAYLNGQVDSVWHDLTIQPFDAQISLVQDTTACSCELPFPKANPVPTPPGPCNRFTLTAQINAGSGGTPSWQWYGPAGPIGSPSSGTTATLQPDSAGYYFLVATVGSCQTSAGVNIKEYNVQDQRANIWYFGNQAGIDFNPVFDNPPGAPEAITNPVMDALEGTSTISDRNGQVIFFTDGNTVWNHDFDVVGTDIGGVNDNSSQAALIIPVPGDETLYYIFTTEEIPGTGTYRLAYSLYDIKLNFPTGGLRAKNVTLFTRSTERITGNENWLIAHEYGNNIFRAYRITTAGIDNPIFSGIGSDHNIAFPTNAEGYMRLGPQNRLAVPIYTPGVSNIVEVFDFIDSAGTVTNLRTINLNNTSGQAYGVEFGAGGNKLYVSLLGSPSSKLYEYAFDTLGIPHQPSGTPRMSDADYPQGLGAIVMGPDQQVYVAVKDQPALGVITVVPDTARASSFQIDAFPLAGGTVSRLGLPNFIQIISDAPQGPSIAHTGECMGSPTSFTGSGTDPIDVLTWAFGDGGGQSGVNLTEVEHTYPTTAVATTYIVTLSISNRCVGLVEVLRDTVTIYPPPPDPSTSLSLCTPPMVIDANPTDTPGLEYLWEDGETTETLTISEPRTYFVTVTSTATQCSTEGAIRVNPALVTINLGPDAVACSAPNTGLTLNTGINIPNGHTWTLNGANLGNTGPTQPVDFSTAGTFTYIATYTGPAPQNCVTRDTITFTVNQSPTVTLTPGAAITCGTNTGQLTAVVTQSTNYFYSFTGPTAIPNGTSPITVPFTGLTAGTYTITVNDQANGCPAGATATINGAGMPTITPVNQAACDLTPQPVTIQSSAPGFLTTDMYTILDANTGDVVESGPVPTPGVQFQTGGLTPGNYNITVYRGGAPPAGCPTGASITLNQGPEIPNVSIDITQLCAAAPQVTAVAPPGPTYTYFWSSSPVGLTGATATIPVNLPPGQYTLDVVVDDGPGGNCPTDAQIDVAIEPGFGADIQYDPCTTPVVLNGMVVNGARPAASYFYTWTGPGVSGTGMQFVATVEGDYTLRIQNPASGCFAVPDAVEEDVRLLGPLTVQILPPDSPPCDNAAFTLEAAPSRTVSTYQWALNSTEISGETTAQLDNQRAAGLYGVKVSDGRCEAEAALQIFLAPSTPGVMQDNFVICPDPNAPPNVQVAYLDPGAGFASYAWYQLVGTSESALPFFGQIYEAREAGSYRVRMENAFGCETSDDAIVEVNCDPVINAPNAFRPTSGLNANQMFHIFTFYVAEEGFQIYIFNRWGEMVFESSDLAFAWNGGYKNNAGQLMPAGTYSYVLKYKSKEENAETREKRGGVLLLR